jgi:hypothetical protein
MPERLDQDLMLKFFGTLDEAQRRWFVGREAILLGHGGIKQMCEVSGLSKPTIIKAIRELGSDEELRREGRIRQTGGGRKRVEEEYPKLPELLSKAMEESTAGDPMSLLKWSNRSTYQISDRLKSLGHPISEDTVQRRLREMGYSLQANVKAKEGSSVPERDSQFRYINEQAKAYIGRGEPVISVDAKKHERVGNFKNQGRKWRPKGKPVKVNVYDYPSLAEGTAIPYGAYDLQRNQGMVNVGVSHETAEFAVESIRRWWKKLGRRHYPDAKRLMISADGGGSNGSRNRAWKFYLQQFCDEMGLETMVCHYPPGTSKWNKIEHRMFSFISINWQGEPLVSLETVINLISATKTKAGLKIKAVLDTREYETGKKISDEEMKELNLRIHDKNPQWNYTLGARGSKSTRR